ncbi:craniofacial development protein 1-like [Diabrotica virgifera virgifera]|uniref:Cilia- and flagella-associated protein 251-like n=1 Tax=Diabrotica virgifera virgifera TaxID=50390 RepID=A0ABM5L4A9_DIAVI|nr:craniofacial development protein 1-like [Diabrotica virgifera virgifera]
MNRSGAQKHSTLVGEEILGEIHREEEEEEKEDGGKREEGSSAEIVENAEAETEGKKESQGEAGWQDIEESILATFLFDKGERIEMQQVKKRKGDSLEINEKFKKEKLEESKKYSEETDKERVQRKIREMLDILNTDGSIEQERIRMKKLLGEINTIQNKTSHIQVSKGEEEEINASNVN